MNGHPPFFANAQLLDLQPADVLVPERIGFLHEDKAVALGRLMAVDGQRTPINVVKRKNAKPGTPQWQLVTGRHRLRGAELEGLPIFAIEVIGKPEDLVDLEASENLHRRPLGPIERAKFTAALVQAAQERIAREHGNLSNQKLGAKIRWEKVRLGETRVDDALSQEAADACDKMSQAYGWAESVADALGLDRRTIHRDLTLYRLLIEPFPDLAQALAMHPVIGENASQLRLIAQVQDEGLRRRVIALVLADGHMTVEAARVEVGVDRTANVEPVPEQKFMNAVVGNLSRLSAPQQKRHVDSLVRALKGDEVKRQLRDRLNQELGE